jgi:hypothetical protein
MLPPLQEEPGRLLSAVEVGWGGRVTWALLVVVGRGAWCCMGGDWRCVDASFPKPQRKTTSTPTPPHRVMDAEISATPVPEEYHGWRADVLCNDCSCVFGAPPFGMPANSNTCQRVLR